MLLAKGQGLCLLSICFLAAFEARAEEPPKELRGVRIVVPEPVGVAHEAVVRSARRELTNAGAEVVDASKLAPKDPIARKAMLADVQKLSNACRALPASYALRVEISRRGWLYAAHAILIDCATSAIKMDFRSEYYKPAQEAGDRGDRIGRKTKERLVALSTPGISPVTTATVASIPTTPEVPTTTTQQGEVPEIGGGTTPPETTVGGELGTSTEFDSLSDEAGWEWNIRGWLGTHYAAFVSSTVGDKERNFAKLGVRSTLTGKIGESLRLRVLPLVELDLLKSRLHRVDLEEGFVEYSKESFELRVGWDALSWGAASTLNIVDVINTRDNTEGIVDAPKIGQPMVSARFLFGDNSFTLMYLTPFIQPKLPRLDSVFNPFQLPPSIDAARFPYQVAYGSKYDEWMPQAAARLALVVGEYEFRASYFYGYARFPLVHLPTASLFFPLIHHLSTDGQILIGKTSITWEGASVWYPTTDKSEHPDLTLPNGEPASSILLPDQRFTWIVGLEHTLDNVIWQGSLVLLAEFVGDSSSRWFTDDRPPDDATNFFENNLIYGFRWTLDNSADSKFSIIDIADLTHFGDHYVNIEYSERWFQNFTFTLGGRIGVADPADKMASLRTLSGIYTQLRLNY